MFNHKSKHKSLYWHFKFCSNKKQLRFLNVQNSKFPQWSLQEAQLLQCNHGTLVVAIWKCMNYKRRPDMK